MRLKELRKRCYMSQADLAKVFGVAQTTLSGWENGTRKPKYDTLVRIAAYFGVSVDYLIGTQEQRRAMKSTEMHPEVRNAIEARSSTQELREISRKVEELNEIRKNSSSVISISLCRVDGCRYVHLRTKGDVDAITGRTGRVSMHSYDDRGHYYVMHNGIEYFCIMSRKLVYTLGLEVDDRA